MSTEGKVETKEDNSESEPELSAGHEIINEYRILSSDRVTSFSIRADQISFPVKRAKLPVIKDVPFKSYYVKRLKSVLNALLQQEKDILQGYPPKCYNQKLDCWESIDISKVRSKIVKYNALIEAFEKEMLKTERYLNLN